MKRSKNHGYLLKSVLLTCFLAVFLVVLVFLSDLRIRREQLLFAMNAKEESYLVREGDSLWSISESFPDDRFPTAYVLMWIKSVNKLESACLYPGQRLIVPVV